MPTLATVSEVAEPTRVGSDMRAAVVFVGAVVVGGVAGFALAQLLGFGEVRWANTQIQSLCAAVGALGAGLMAGNVLLARDGSAFMVRVPGPLRSWPGSHLGAGP